MFIGRVFFHELRIQQKENVASEKAQDDRVSAIERFSAGSNPKDSKYTVAEVGAWVAHHPRFKTLGFDDDELVAAGEAFVAAKVDGTEGAGDGGDEPVTVTLKDGVGLELGLAVLMANEIKRALTEQTPPFN